MIDEGLTRVGAFLINQIGGTFLSPSSTLSVPCLAVTVAIAVVLVMRRRRAGRTVPARVLLRALFPRRMFGTPSGRLDAWFFVLSTAGIGVLFGWAITSAGWVRAAAGAIFGQPAALIHLPAAAASCVATLALFVAYEFAYWLDHWIKHRFAPMWAFHKVHHDAESLSLLTNFRVHPVDTIVFYNIVALITGATTAVLDIILGADTGIVSIGTTNVIVMAAAVGLTHLQHSHFWIGVGFRGWLLGPAHHQIHHSAEPTHHNRNFGSSLALWDRLFGTYHAPTQHRPPLEFGAGSPTQHRLGEAFWRPFVEMFDQRPRRTKAQADTSIPTASPEAVGIRAYAAFSISACASRPRRPSSSGRSGPGVGG